MPKVDESIDDEYRAYKADRSRWFTRLGIISGFVAILTAIVAANADNIAYMVLGDWAEREGMALGLSASLLSSALAFGSLYAILQIFLEVGGGSFFRNSGRPRSPSEQIALPTEGIWSPMAAATVARLREELRAQGQRANLNLTVGLFAAVSAIGFLVWLAIITADFLIPNASNTAQPSFSTTIYWGSFASKIAVSISANIFAFFFLSTYRRNLNEIRYFQNELTNLESQFFSLFFAKEQGFEDAQKKILMALSATERNFVLRKGETTTDIAMRRMDVDEVRSLVAVLNEKLQASQAGPKERPVA